MKSPRLETRPSGSAQEGSGAETVRGTARTRSEGPRKPYRAPRLELCGKLSEIIQFGGSVPIDSGGGLGHQP